MRSRTPLAAMLVAAVAAVGCTARQQTSPIGSTQSVPVGLDLGRIQSRDSERGLVLTIPEVLFEIDKAELRLEAQKDLVAIAAYLKDSDQKVLIEGHTDSTGTEAYNDELSLRRGTTVETFFLKHGVDPERIEVRGLGEDQPIASNATVAGRQQNRRVEIVMLDGGEKTVRTDERAGERRR